MQVCARSLNRLRAFPGGSRKSGAGRILVRLKSVALLNRHVAELFGIKDFAALQAFDELSVLMPGDDAHAGMFAYDRHCAGKCR